MRFSAALVDIRKPARLLGDQPTPYRDWTRNMLELIRESSGSGLTLTHSEDTPGRYHVCIATREQIAVHGFRDGDTSILRAAAWDAQLSDVDAAAFRLFDDERARQGRYLVLLQTPEWEFLTNVNGDDSRPPSRLMRVCSGCNSGDEA